MKDKKEYGPVDMLKELRENDEARYPANTAYRSGKTDSYDQNSGYPDQKRGGGYTAHAANVKPFPDTHPDIDSDPDPFGGDSEEAYDEGYYIGVVHTADELDWRLGLCFNCGQAGYQWRDCTEPLKDSLKAAKE